MDRDLFAHKAESYERNARHVDNVDGIARAIRDAVPLHRAMHLMDFGSGTGLLLERLAPQVGRITAVDISPAMNRQLEAKRAALGCEVVLCQVDLEATDIDGGFDGIVSSMSLHHVRDVPALLARFHRLLAPGGFIALSDLDTEDGSFHSEDTGVFHFGFDREAIAAAAREAGFRDVAVRDASVVRKPERDYPVFLLLGRR